MGSTSQPAGGAIDAPPVDATWPIAVLTSPFCPDFEPQRLSMAICVSYLEPIETEDEADTFTVAGLLSSKARWREFETRWSQALRREHLPAFNAVDFLQLRGAFASGWNDTRRQRALLETLGRLTAQHLFLAFSCSVRLADYHAVDTEYALSDTGTRPYGLCSALLIASIRRWMRTTHPDDLTLFILREGDLDGRELRPVLSIEGAEQGEPPQVWPRQWVDECGRHRYLRPLEACELLTADRDGGLVSRLLERGQLVREEINRDRLVRICRDLRIARRAERPAADDPNGRAQQAEPA